MALPTPIRTNGDGMENPDNLDEITSILTKKTGRLSLGEKFLYRPVDYADCITTQPVIPSGPMIHLKPKCITTLESSKDSALKNMRGREPKFVPYEPYKAAVNPIIPTVKKEKPRRRSSKANVNISTTSVGSVGSVGSDCKDDASLPEWDKQSVTTEMDDLRNKNEELEKQLQFQVQVNSDLKSMLVAAVGEDLEVRVQHLTEDKLQLARALLNSSDNLSSHQEQLEWLAGQCEVWRSKFLASSLMLEELARWKAALHQRNAQLEDTLRQLLDERDSARDGMAKTFRTLQVLRENFDPASGMSLATIPHRRMSSSSSTNMLSSGNMMDLSSANLRLSECLAQRLLGSAAPTSASARETATECANLDHRTPAEKRAHQLLQVSPAELLGQVPDLACNAVVGAAAAAGSGLFPHISSTPTTCCAHCSGDMKVL